MVARGIATANPLGLGFAALLWAAVSAQTVAASAPRIEIHTYKSVAEGDLAMRVHFPPDGAYPGLRPAIVFFYGGPKTGESLEQFRYHAGYLASRGMVAALADFRAGNRDSEFLADCVEDAKSAIRWLRANASPLGIDPDRLAAAGGSRGGRMAACAHTAPGFEAEGENTAISSKPDLLILFNPILGTENPRSADLGYSQEAAAALSPLALWRGDGPPSALFYGSLDPFLSQGRQWLARAQTGGAPCVLYIAPRENHGFFNRQPWLDRALYHVDRFLEEQGWLGGTPALTPNRYALFERIPPAGVDGPSESDIQTGHFQARFAEHDPRSKPGEINRRFRLVSGIHALNVDANGYPYNIEEETFEVYVPETYRPDTPHGLLVHISPGESGGMPWDGLTAVLDRRRLIWIGANRSGNGHGVFGRRIPLALDAAHNMRSRYNIDPERVYVEGVSGGGRAASMTAFHHPDVWTGGIFIIGVNYWETVRNPGRPDTFWKASFNKPAPEYLSMAARLGRYVFLTGDNDANRAQTLAYYERGYKPLLRHSLYIQVPGMGHEIPPPEWLERALDFLDGAG